MAQITYYAPAGVTSINLSDGSRAVVVNGNITVDSKFRNELEAAGCTADADTDNAVRFAKTLTGRLKVSADGKDVMAEMGVGQVPSLYGQPPRITRNVKAGGSLVCNFARSQWIINGGTPTLTQGVTNYDANGDTTGIASRTGQPEMLKWEPTSAAAADIRLQTPATMIRTKALGGKIRLWVHVANMPGYEAGVGDQAGSISLTLTTNAGASNTNALAIKWTANQLREGWNCLDFVMRNPLAYSTGGGGIEYHPFGVQSSCQGNGVDADIKNNDLTAIKVGADSFAAGTVLHFDSLWTGFDSLCQVVLGCDAVSSDLVNIALPIFQSYGWIGYVATPMRMYPGGDKIINTMQTISTVAQATYAAGWENVNHTANHIPLNTMTNPAEIAYELLLTRAWGLANSMPRGAEFYASPQSATSRLAEKVVADLGFKVQRHGRKFNISQTGFGIDNPHNLGSIDWGSASSFGVQSTSSGVLGSIIGQQTASKIKRQIDVAIDYGCAVFPFWHGITTLGDSGTGEDLTGDNLQLTKSAFTKAMAYIKEKEDAGLLQVADGFAGFYYGMGR